MPDNLTPEQRQKTMRAVKSRDTSLEKTVSSALHRRGLRYQRCVASLPGKPDFVFPKLKIVVFVDGDFWHGWRFSEWKDKLQPYWKEKIERNRRRDQCNFRKLRRKGWMVLHFWEHQVQRNLKWVVNRVATVVMAAKQQQQEMRDDGRIIALPGSSS